MPRKKQKFYLYIPDSLYDYVVGVVLNPFILKLTLYIAYPNKPSVKL